VFQPKPNQKVQALHTKMSLTLAHIRVGEGKGSSKRATPYTATAKKCRIKLKGEGYKPDINDIGPFEKMPPSLKYSKHASCIAGGPQKTLYKASANVFIVDAIGYIISQQC